MVVDLRCDDLIDGVSHRNLRFHTSSEKTVMPPRDTKSNGTRPPPMLPLVVTSRKAMVKRTSPFTSVSR